MKIYDIGAPNPRRLRIFLAEKKLEVPFEAIDVGAGANRTGEFLDKNSLGKLPVLELDDGTCISESVAICRFFELKHPDPPLMDVDAVDQAVVEMWNRRIEFGLFRFTADYFQHTAPFFKDQFVQLPAYAEIAKASAKKELDWLDEALEGRRFVAGENFTIADITAWVALDLGTPSVYTIEPDLKNLSRWHAEVSSRPSASA